ncbi:Sodium/hydrogen exchanger 9B1, partial [Sciurus carolinensis]|nr:Sodium/hydrogen exchanger 9B1 [Sciurus carolinensis]
ILNDPNNSIYEEAKGTTLSETKEVVPQTKKQSYISCPPQGIVNKIITNGAVSPAVVVPSMLLLQEKGYGIEKGIPTLLIAASSLDDIMAITGFNTMLSIVFSTGSILDNILSSLRDILVGVLVGTILGCFIRYFPSDDQIRVQNIVANTWDIFQPLLFGLVGSEVTVSALESNTIAADDLLPAATTPTTTASTTTQRSAARETPGLVACGCIHLETPARAWGVGVSVGLLPLTSGEQPPLSGDPGQDLMIQCQDAYRFGYA